MAFSITDFYYWFSKSCPQIGVIQKRTRYLWYGSPKPFLVKNVVGWQLWTIDSTLALEMLAQFLSMLFTKILTPEYKKSATQFQCFSSFKTICKLLTDGLLFFWTIIFVSSETVATLKFISSSIQRICSSVGLTNILITESSFW